MRFFDLITSILKHTLAPSYYDFARKITFDLDNKNKINFAGFSYIDQTERTETIKEKPSD